MRVQHNVNALNAHRQLGINSEKGAKSLEKLSSGFRINRAGDDAAGLAISEKMRAQISGLGVAEKNALDGISLIQTAEGGLQETHSILQRMRDLAVQSANGIYDDTEDRARIQSEITALTNEINNIADNTKFNGKELLKTAGSVTFQIGANHETVILTLTANDATTLGVDLLALGSQTGASAAIDSIDTAIKTVNINRADLGAIQNRLEHTINNLGVSKENLTAAESRIRDTDMAKEMMEYTKMNILGQAAQSMLAQANQQPQQVLQLLR